MPPLPTLARRTIPVVLAGAALSGLAYFLLEQYTTPHTRSILGATMIGPPLARVAIILVRATIAAKGGPPMAGEVTALDVIDEWGTDDLETLRGLAADMRASRESVLRLLTGGNPERLRLTDERLQRAAADIDEAITLGQQLLHGLRAHRSRP